MGNVYLANAKLLVSEVEGNVHFLKLLGNQSANQQCLGF